MYLNCWNDSKYFLHKTYFLRQIVLTNANSTSAEKMKPVQPKNQISLAFMYDTFGRVFACDDAKVINDNIVAVPEIKLINLGYSNNDLILHVLQLNL